jgi:hypothetical protein
MKRILYVSAFALLTLSTGIAVAQDLGTVARQQRQQKKPSAKKVYTNEDFGGGQPAATPEAAPAADAKPDAAAAPAAKPVETSSQDKSKASAALQQQVDATKAEIASLTRELDIANRENKLRVANYYADAGNSLRDPKKWQDEQKATQDEINNKQKAIDSAKAKLADLVEQGRKAGVKVNE